MARNKGPGSGATGGGRGGGFLTGLLVGILVGIGMALAVAVWLNVHGSPFSEREAPAELPPIKRPVEPSGPAAGGSAETAAPGGRADEVTPQDDRGAAADRPGPARSASPGSLYLQAGAFRNASEADDRKASVNLLGETVAVQRVVGSGGLLYRIRVGPFSSQAELERARELLRLNGIDSIPVRPDATTP